MADVTSFATPGGLIQEVAPATPLPVADAAVLAAVEAMTAAAEATTAAVNAMAETPVTATLAAPMNIATGIATLNAQNSLIVAARTGRKSVTIIQESQVLIRLGGPGVTLQTGARLDGIVNENAPIEGGAEIHGVVAPGATATVSYIEVF